MCPGAASLNHRGRSARLADTDVPTLEMYVYYYPHYDPGIKYFLVISEPPYEPERHDKRYAARVRIGAQSK